MTGDEIRTLFLKFFESKGHKVLPSSSLVPYDDPTLLLTSAGMVQIKPYFLGEAVPPGPRLASCQKCFRTTDIEAVGDTKHLTFFEMLGNFSVGNYFKKEAISWGLEFVTQHLKLPLDHLWVSIFNDDEESLGIWKEAGFPEERIVRCGEEDNFWGPAGESGPCGPCSEIHWDRGESFGCGKDTCGPSCDCERFLEIWNLVFTQFNQDRQGNRTPLPKPNIDTGMGLERVALVLQGKNTVYECDIFAPIVEKITKLAGRPDGKADGTERTVNVIAEHSRGAVFLIADGVVPGSDGRGYILRRVLRRAMAFGKKTGLPAGFLGELAEVVITKMGKVYPELVNNREHILRVLETEERRFNNTLELGLNILDRVMDGVRSKGRTTIGGTEVFRLYDTYGFPGELTAEIAAENDLSIDKEAFESEMSRQRERSRAAAKFGLKEKLFFLGYGSMSIPSTVFSGYEVLRQESRIEIIATSSGGEDSALEGEEAEIVLNTTPFYAEMGGQVADKGTITGENGSMEVEDVQWAGADLIVHRGKIVKGILHSGDSVIAEVDRDYRFDIARNHTATHILQYSLRKVLGEQVHQAGSLVTPEKLRFDFNHLGEVGKERLKAIQHIINSRIRDNMKVEAELLPFDEAIARGATALFSEKYGESVRLVCIGEPAISRELCGGTHMDYTGSIGMFYFTEEESIGAGLRRVEAVTGKAAEAFVEERLQCMDSIISELKVSCDSVYPRVCSIMDEIEAEKKKATRLEKEIARVTGEALLKNVELLDGVSFLATRVNVSSVEALREMGDFLSSGIKSGVVVLGAVINDKSSFMVMVTPDLVARGYHAGNIVKKLAMVAGGTGGGRADMAQAGAKDKTRLDEALKEVKNILGNRD
ncbi:alanine--tRNA ligase [Chloroflexota bacterium]